MQDPVVELRGHLRCGDAARSLDAQAIVAGAVFQTERDPVRTHRVELSRRDDELLSGEKQLYAARLDAWQVDGRLERSVLTCHVTMRLLERAEAFRGQGLGDLDWQD